MSWNFAIINNRLAEIFHEGKSVKDIKIFGHAFVKKEEYTTKQEQEWIKADTKKLNFSYRKGIYKSKNTDFKANYHLTPLSSTQPL